MTTLHIHLCPSIPPSVSSIFLFFPGRAEVQQVLYVSCSTFAPLSPFRSYSLSPGQSENEVVSVQFLSRVHPVKEREKKTEREKDRRQTDKPP